MGKHSIGAVLPSFIGPASRLPRVQERPLLALAGTASRRSPASTPNARSSPSSRRSSPSSSPSSQPPERGQLPMDNADLCRVELCRRNIELHHTLDAMHSTGMSQASLCSSHCLLEVDEALPCSCQAHPARSECEVDLVFPVSFINFDNYF
jgi:hypothetical protein